MLKPAQYTILCLLTCCVLSCISTSKNGPDKKLLATQEIRLPSELQHGLEFSGLCAWGKDKIVMLPQNTPYLCWFTREGVKEALQKDTVIKVEKIPFNLSEIRAAVNHLNNEEDVFDGLEAIICVQDDFFFSVETKDNCDNCYLVRAKPDNGIIKADCNSIIKVPKITRDSKGDIIHNAGYESGVWMKSTNKLLLFFEFNDLIQHNPVAVSVASGNVAPIPISRIPFRITDAFSEAENIFALNYNYKNEKAIKQPSEIKEFSYDMYPHRDDICRIVVARYDKKNNTISKWNLVGYLPISSGLNWEGLCRYDNGFLMVTDDNKWLTTKLLFVR